MLRVNNEDLKSITYDSATYMLKWYMTSWCNYHCPYCIQYKQMDCFTQEEIEEKAILINRMLLNNNINKPLFLKLIGGECTIYNLIAILDKFTVDIKNISLTTNFFRPNEYFKDLLSYCRSRCINLSLCLSKHDENKNFYDKALNLTLWCRENDYKDPEICIVAPFDLNYSDLTKYMDLGLKRIRISPVRDPSTNIAYTPNSEEQKLIELVHKNNSYSRSKGNYIFTFKDGTSERTGSVSDYVVYFNHGGLIPDGRLCSAGVNSIVIKPKGDIYRGGCHYLNNLHNIKENCIGWITDEEIKLPDKFILCKTNFTKYSENLNLRCVPCDHISLGELVDENLYNKVVEKETRLNATK